MRAVVVRGWATPPQVETLEVPTRTTGTTLVRMGAATVGHLDRTILSGGFLHAPELPYIPGVEGAGTVVESDSFEPGARVWLRGAGLGISRDGTWSEVVLAPDAAVGALPDDVGIQLGSVFFSPCTSAWVSLHRVAALQPGERVLVSGPNGAVGSVTVQLALDAGAEVVAAVSSEAAARDLPDGVEVLVLDGSGAGPGTPPEPADVLVDPVGGPVLEQLLQAVRPGGRAVLVGYVAGTEVRLDLPAFVQRDVSLLPLNMIRRESQGRAAVPELLERLGDGRIQIPTTSFGLSEVGDALDWLGRRGRRGRAVLLPD